MKNVCNKGGKMSARKMAGLLLCGWFAGFLFLARAEDVILRVPDVDVFGYREEENENVNLEPSKTVITRERIEESGAETLVELLKKESPGIFVTERGVMGYGIGPGSAGGLTIRGSQSWQRFLMLIDGRPEMMGVYGHPVNDSYFLENVERVEIIQGPISVRYGNASVSGAINIITRKRISPGFETKTGASFGSWSTSKENISHGGMSGKTDYYVTGFNASTDGPRENSEAESKGGSLHLGRDLGKSFYLSLDGRSALMNNEDPGTRAEVSYVENRGEEIEKYSYINRNNIDLTLHHKTERSKGLLKFYRSYGKHKIRNGGVLPVMGTTVPNRYWFDSWDAISGVLVEETLDMDKGWLLTLGGDFREYSGDLSITTPAPYISAFAPTDPAKLSQTEYSGYALLEKSMLRGNLVAASGIRLQKHEAFDAENVPAFSIKVIPWNKGKMQVSAAKGWRAPTLAERYVVAQKNSSVEAENLWNYEWGFSQEVFSWMDAEINTFYQKGTNFIQAEGTPAVYYNTGSFVHKGAESILSFHS